MFSVEVTDYNEPGFVESDLTVEIGGIAPTAQVVNWFDRFYDLRVVYCLEDRFPVDDYYLRFCEAKP